MPVIVKGLGEPIEIRCYVAAEPAERGIATLTVGLPARTIWQVAAEGEAEYWPSMVKIVADRQDGCVEVRLAITAPVSYPLTLHVRWGEDEQTIRGPSDQGYALLLDGLPGRGWHGMLERHGGPELAGEQEQALVAASINGQADVPSPFGPQASVG